MLKDLEEGRLPSGYSYGKASSNWGLLHSLWNQSPFADRVRFIEQEMPDSGISWVIDEHVGEFSFHLHRGMITGVRITDANDCGLLGLSLINPNDRRVILTEGVSDYFTVKMHCPDMNVLGVTNLGGSNRARVILLNLFDKILYCRDNDSAGLGGAMKLKGWLEQYGKHVKIWSPSADVKDCTDMFVRNIRFSGID